MVVNIIIPYCSSLEIYASFHCLLIWFSASKEIFFIMYILIRYIYILLVRTCAFWSGILSISCQNART
jgi:hypothetical protein